jgi:hypothetical protein
VALLSVQQYVALGRDALIDLLRQEHAVLWSEAQARISDVRWKSVPRSVDPHHLSTARGQLLARNRITLIEATTRGQHKVPVLHLSDTRGIATQVRKASERKRALMATLNSWIRPRSGYPLGLVGAAGERVAHASLLTAAPHGWRLVRPEGGEVRHLLGHAVEGGALDSAGWVTSTDEIGVPLASVLCPIEVKNVRHWIYPNVRELFQLLYKAARLQIQHPGVHICPVLITRRKSFTANAMSREMGFRILDTGKQYVLPVAAVDRAALARIQDELGFQDLTATDEADPGLTEALRQVPKTALNNAERWKTFGPALVHNFEPLREDLRHSEREQAMNELRDAVREIGGDVRW